MSINVRTKGHGGEREVCRAIADALGVKMERNVDQVRDGGADIISLKPFAIEVKRQQQLSIKRWLAQAQKQTTRENPIPVLWFRQDRQKWRVMVPVDWLVRKKFRATSEWMEISPEYFISCARVELDR